MLLQQPQLSLLQHVRYFRSPLTFCLLLFGMIGVDDSFSVAFMMSYFYYNLFSLLWCVLRAGVGFDAFRRNDLFDFVWCNVHAS